MFPSEHPAGRKYVLTPGGPYCGHYSGTVQPVSEHLDHLVGGSVIRKIRNAVEAYEIHPAFKP